MKKITLLLILFLSLNMSFSQGTDILSSEQFCSGTSELTFNNVYGGTNLTAVGCLGSIPNASYFFMEIDLAGDLIFTISQETTAGTPIDVDFIAWGPFVDLNDANASISYTDCPTCPNNTTDPTFYPYAPDFITDCSFDSAPTETMNILNAMQGEIYVVLITNYDGAQGTISFQQTGGNGTTTCASVPVCGSQYFDGGGPTGPYSGNETTTINPYFAGGTVTVDFTTVNIPDAGDVLTVYNGPNNTFPVLGTVTTTGSFTSTTVGNPTGAITFELITDGDANTGTGWVADITCTAPPTPPTCGFTFYDSGGAGGNYSANELQTTTFYPDTAGDVVTATFTAFNLENTWDDLTVYDGPNTTYPSLGTFTGTTIPGPFTSTDASGALTFVFDSDSTTQLSGWAADLTCSTPVCGSTFYDSGGSGGNYAANESQTTTFFPDTAGNLITATFTAFNTQNGTDELNVYDGPDATYPLLGTFSGTTIPGPFTSSDVSGALTFVFTSNGSVQNSGWVADITCSPSTYVCGSIFYDSGGASGNYASNELTTTTFFPDTAGLAITATFTMFDTEGTYDELSVYDGPDATYPLLGIFSGTSIPGPFTSSDASGALTFVFDSDSSVEYDGWAANLSCAPYVPPAVCGNTFYDSGGAGGDYFSNEYTTTTLIPDIPGTSVTVTFTAFDLESCCDELLVYDGPDATYPLLGTFTGTAIPGPFTSTDPSGALTFVFDSDSSVEYEGWAADITCIDNCNMSITDTIYPIGADTCSLDYTELVATTNSPSSNRTTVFSETFDGAGFPAGWTTANATTNTQWIISNTANAGGTAREAMLDWDSGFDNGTWTLTSPQIDITGETNLELDYRQELDHWSASYSYSVYVETSTDNTNWTVRYSVINVSANIPASVMNHDISSHDGNTSLYVRFRFAGETFGILDWSIDNIYITADGAPATPQITWSPTTGLYTDSGLTTPYSGGFTDTVYAVPNGIQTYTATDQNSCTETVTVTHNKKVWNGSDISDGTNWYVGNNWTPFGVPSINSCVVIPDNSTVPNNPIADKTQVPIPLPPQPATARNLTLEADAYLEIDTNTEIIVQEWVNVQNTGILNLKSSSSLIQVDDSAVNTGEIHMQRSPNFDESAVANSEYVYWSSPVASFQVSDISPGSTQMYYWTPTVATNAPGFHGEWYAASGNMTDGTGYIVRGLSGTPTNIPATTYTIPNNTALFSGVPNNGIITKPISHGNWNGGTYAGNGNTATNEDDNWNLIGNPYPSAISANAFVNLNTAINGTVYVWPHDSTYSDLTADPFYEDYVYNYDGNDYIEHNNTGSNPPGTNDLFIGSGQGFFVLMNHSAPVSSNVTFNNSMRQVLSSYNNNTFFRTDGSGNNSTVERHRIWLNLLSPNDITNSILVGYVENATNDFDRLYDGYDFSEGSNGFYSLLDNQTLSIQGRSLPFLQEDIVPLGLIANETGVHTIAINTLDGLFLNEGQNIYIEDTELNVIHDIRNSPYNFSIEEGIHDTRFILRYTYDTLGVNDFDNGDISIIAPNSDYIKIKSEIGLIDNINVYDILGRVIFEKNEVNDTEFILNETRLSHGAYIVKVVLVNGKQKIQKVVIRQ